MYAKCAPIEAINEIDVDRLRLDETAPNLKIKTTQRSEGGNNVNRMATIRSKAADTSQSSSSSPIPRMQTMKPTESATPPPAALSRQATTKSILKNSGAPSPMRPGTLTPAASSNNVNSSGGPPPRNYRNAKDIDWPEELERFYVAIKMPEKISGIKTILKTWSGKEDAMIASLIEKYQKSMPKDALARMEQLHLLLESNTETSFNVRTKR